MEFDGFSFSRERKAENNESNYIVNQENEFYEDNEDEEREREFPRERFEEKKNYRLKNISFGKHMTSSEKKPNVVYNPVPRVWNIL